jgi:hypothetical protein
LAHDTLRLSWFDRIKKFLRLTPENRQLANAQIIQMSDRAYLALPTGWRRLRPGQTIKAGEHIYEVMPDGKSFKCVA